MLTEWALFALTCCGLYFFDELCVNPQLKYVNLADNVCLKNEKIIMLASIFPNLHLLDLSVCLSICEEGIGQDLRTCCNIRELNLTGCPNIRKFFSLHGCLLLEHWTLKCKIFFPLRLTSLRNYLFNLLPISRCVIISWDLTYWEIKILFCWDLTCLEICDVRWYLSVCAW
jgi:hypothetical protein